MKKNIQRIVLILLTMGSSLPSMALCGFGTSTPYTPPPPQCYCAVNKVAIKLMVNGNCAQEKCVSAGAATHYLNQGWINGCCAVARLGNNIPGELTIDVYPNPVKDQLHLPAGYNEIEILDALGNRVFIENSATEAGQNGLVVDVNTWSAGIYFVKIHTAEKTVIRKVVKL